MDNTREQQIKRWKERDYSWSQHSSFIYDPEQWYKKYILGEDTLPSEEMKFGSKVGKKLEKDPTYLPMIPRQSKMEYEFKVNIGGIVCLGYADSFCIETFKKGEEYKTGVKEWNQKRVDEHGQITMYLLMNYITNKIKPDNVNFNLHWMPTKRTETGDFKVVIEFVDDIENNIKHFKTKRTMTDILKFAGEIKKIRKDMEIYALTHV